MKHKFQASFSLLNVLAFAILATIYLAWVFYPLEIKWLGLENIVYMKAADISYNFNTLMHYLTNPFQQVLSMPNFSSSDAGLHHFHQVKILFHLAQVIFLLTLPALILFIKNVILKGYGHLFQRKFVIAAILPIVIGFLAFLIGFDTFFVLFHKLLFPGDSTWLFDPNQDPVIYILPQDFFMHCFILFFFLYEFLMCAMIFLCCKKKVV
ncbi:TIGR01906 family membrane protein [Streptococcus sp. X16XC17]|uniref:TIGR01906 family membrane protein n=1 Tax=unclassified Streptococcus TaxID=2608887 RepID=UPI00066FC7C8|nr:MULTISPECIES: TIGR01906 family membrane protein [unclassified Streptococcus]TCD46468.1 TIGR01906 family membrane protein [Streptococcus sp. X16XC17]